MEETIAAVSTAYGEGGIGIVRMSGESAKDVLDSLFCRVSDNIADSSVNDSLAAKKIIRNIDIEPRKLTYGNIADPATGEIIDEVLVCYMPAPHTYTTEDVVEIDCHGSIVSLRRILSLCLENGARLAEPGEFTKRAFLGGRLDLSQAEAVIDMIKAKTDGSFDAAIGQLEGKLSKEIRKLRAALLDILVNITVNIDYPDQDIEEILYDDIEKQLSTVKSKVADLINDGEKGRIVREGIDVAIVGKPNVGKSSLMNALLRETRAIVTEIPGTTRDTIEASVNIGGIPVRLTDTAGIRDTEDKIEQIGIRRSWESIESADLVVLLLDVSRGLEQEDLEITDLLKEFENKKILILANKQDLDKKIEISEIEDLLPGSRILETSLTGEDDDSIRQMENTITDMVMGGEVRQANSMMVTNVRHLDLLKNCLSAIGDAIDITRLAEPLELIEIDISRGYGFLGEIIGEETSDDIINEVFARFCLGK